MLSSLFASGEGEGQQLGAGTNVCWIRACECRLCPLSFQHSAHNSPLQKDHLCLAACSFLPNSALNFKMKLRCWQTSVLRRGYIFFITCVAFRCLATRYRLFKVGSCQGGAQRAAKETCPRCPSGARLHDVTFPPPSRITYPRPAPTTGCPGAARSFPGPGSSELCCRHLYWGSV